MRFASNAIRVHAPGGPEALRWEEQTVREPGPGEALVRLKAVGVNFIDVYYRTGLYPAPAPFTPGMEGAGIVERVGPGCHLVKVGDRVAFASQLGSYAEHVTVPEAALVPVPEALEYSQAAAALLQGMTAQYLCCSTFPVRNGHRVLIHAAAGGVGLLLTQLIARKGATIVALVSSEEKAKLAEIAGAQHCLMINDRDFSLDVRRLLRGGCDVVFDSVGKSTYERSLRCLAPRGYLVLYGNASGPVPPIDPLSLTQAGSVFLTRPRLGDYIADRQSLTDRAEFVFRSILSRALTLKIGASFPLHEAARAHELLESRRSTGKILLLPEETP
jgi:NADPH2:quinone reductase